MKPINEVRTAFAELPPKITNKQIADATGLTLHGVRNWVYDKELFADFPPELPETGPRGVKFRDRDLVLTWIVDRFGGEDTASGPRDVAEAARRARPRRAKMDSKDLARTLGISVRGVNYYASAYSSEKTDTPFPEPDENGERDWPAVREWILHNAERERKPSKTSTRDARGLTAREQEVLELVQGAENAGTTVTPAWLAEQLGLKTTDSANRLLRAIEPHRGQTADRLRPTALAEAVGTTTDMLKYYAKTYGNDPDDPFPAKDANSARSVTEVKEWIERRERAAKGGRRS